MDNQEKMLSWQCIGHAPTVWGLGVYDGDFLRDIVARVCRRRDGAWDWVLFVEGWKSTSGREPSRVLAINAVSESFERLEQEIKSMIFNADNPTDPSSYVVQFQGIGATPLNWQNEQTGVLRGAIMAYLNQAQTVQQLRLVIAYVQHYIHAPCWADIVVDEPDRQQALEQLQKSSMALLTVSDVNQWLGESVKFGVDPL